MAAGTINLKAGEILFNDGDPGGSLFIIQKGQLRLFKPKGRGFIELAVLRKGEVIGEMAFFDNAAKGGNRSCSAEAMIDTEIVEIPYDVFGKILSDVTPWLKTIVHTMADRLRASGKKIRELESNGYKLDGGFEFFKNYEIVKLLASIFLTFKAHGEETANGIRIHRKLLDLYAKDVYTLGETKIDEMIIILKDLGYLTLENDEDGFPKLMVLNELNELRKIFSFYNSERYLADEKKLHIPDNTHTFLERIYEKYQANKSSDSEAVINIQSIIDDFENRNIKVRVDDLEESKVAGITGDVIVGEGNQISVEVNTLKLVNMLPIIRFIAKVRDINRKKSGNK